MRDESTRSPFEVTDGVLHINVPGTEMRIRWAPTALAEEKNSRGIWKQCWPAFRLLRPLEPSKKNGFEIDLHMTASDADLLEQKKRAFDAFRASIPAEIVALVERFVSHQWALLELLASEKASIDLARANPVLAYSLANNAEFRGTDPTPAAFQALCYCKRKQRWISKWLGFPDSEAMVRLLKKFTPEAVCPSLLRQLQFALKDRPQIMGLLAHHKSINAGLLELVMNPHLMPLVTPRLLAEIADNQDDELANTAASLLSEAMNILRQIAPGRQIAPFARMAQVREFSETTDAEYIEHQRLKEVSRLAAIEARARQEQEAARGRRERAARRQRQREVDAAMRHRPFPPPPIPGVREIVPIANLEDLCAEGRVQHNCVGSYGGRVRKGKTYIYRVLYPERATLSIIKGADGCWHRDQLKKARNDQVRQSTKHFVDNWLAQNRLSV